MSNLTGKVAIVTGASKGIGAAIAKTLAARGAALVVNYASSKAGAEAVVKSIIAADGKAIAVQGDVSKVAEAKAVVDAAIAAYGRLDILVNNSGVYEFGPLESVTEPQFHKMFDVNVLGLLLVTQAAAPHLREGGSIINIGSVSAHKGQIGQVNYATAKAAMHGFSRALAAEVASRGVTVNTLSPGYIASQAISSFPPDVLDRLAASVPVRRLGRPEEVAGLCAWLASDEASYVTGADYPVNGGLYMG